MTKRLDDDAEPDDAAELDNDADEAEFTFSFMISGEITIYASTEEEAEELVRTDLERIKVGGQDIDTTVETCTLIAVERSS